MRSLLLLVSACALLSGCLGGQERALLPVAHAPKRVAQQEVPPDGIIQLEAGDTIYTVANRYRMSPRRIILANELPPPYSLQGFSSIKLPKPRGHIVRAGDTLESISGRYRVTKAELIRINALQAPYALRPGMQIAIPRDLDYSLLERQAPATTTTTASAVAPRVSIGKKAVKPKTPIKAVRYSDAADDFTWPVDGSIIDRFGNAAKGVHNDGVNIMAPVGTPVRASFSGEVAFVGSGLKSFGNLVLIKHQDGWITAYAHLGEVNVTEGDKLSRGTIIGSVGQTGRVDSPQLHFEIRKSRTPVNPEDYLS